MQANNLGTRQDLTIRTAREHERDIESLHRFYRQELESLHADMDCLRRLHEMENELACARMGDLQRQLLGLTWTQQHRDEARQLGISQLFDRLLLAVTPTECEGLGELLSKAGDVGPGSLLDDWVSQSHWEARLCAYVEQSQGGGASIDVCIQVAR